MAYDVTLITGDGTGPELAEAARKCVDATGVSINWDVQEAGIDVMERLGTPIPDSTIASIRRTGASLPSVQVSLVSQHPRLPSDSVSACQSPGSAPASMHSSAQLPVRHHHPFWLQEGLLWAFRG
ncbi:MAG: isocitrate/isopropylmalate family dehydrogenase [Pirellulales bacterium]